MRFSSSDKVKISDQVLSQEVNGETVLLDLGSEFYFGLDATGTRIWQLLKSGLSIEEVIGTMLDEYEVEREKLKADLNELLGNLSDAGLVSIDRN